jgi:hypothetical protein
MGEKKYGNDGATWPSSTKSGKSTRTPTIALVKAVQVPIVMGNYIPEAPKGVM